MKISKRQTDTGSEDQKAQPPEEDISSAVALGYDPLNKEGAPTILASAQGELADQILALAKESDIPIHKDPDLLALLTASDVGDEIPLEAFIAVAEILRFIYEQNGIKIPSS
ncbi:EscU/YscU/HrcU family type III secretion system export apparatus switch protein [Curvivirga sp.]|uniref:EscU/YscU/HrcU family type III secretion system export apparatus switch protein n=1 Tax=Curvivirga sp. TaxID=2856848 RepID=UPI003B5BFA7C